MLDWALTLFFPFSDEIEGVSRYTKIILLKWLKMCASNNKLSQNFAEHVSYLMEALTPFFLHQRPVSFVWLYKIFLSIMVVNIILIMETRPPQLSFTRVWCMWLSRNLSYGELYKHTRIVITSYHTRELVSPEGDISKKLWYV